MTDHELTSLIFTRSSWKTCWQTKDISSMWFQPWWVNNIVNITKLSIWPARHRLWVRFCFLFFLGAIFYSGKHSQSRPWSTTVPWYIINKKIAPNTCIYKCHILHGEYWVKHIEDICKIQKMLNALNLQVTDQTLNNISAVQPSLHVYIPGCEELLKDWYALITVCKLSR